MKPVISVTDKAADYIKQVLQQQHAHCLEIGVNGKGCNGLSYTFDIRDHDDIHPGDETVLLDNEYQIRIPQECVMYLLGSTVDYHKDAWSSKLVVNNPLAVSRCGCGTSFSVD